jgi:hypothetical protein
MMDAMAAQAGPGAMRPGWRHLNKHVGMIGATQPQRIITRQVVGISNNTIHERLCEGASR